MAIPLRGEPRLIDPHGGRADLGAGLLRVLHRASFADDPTRAIRAARYAARLGFELEPETEALLRATDLEHRLRRSPPGRAAAAGGRSDGAARLRAAGRVGAAGAPRGRGRAGRRGSPSCSPRRPGPSEAPRAPRRCSPPPSARAGGERELAAAAPERPSEAVALARGHDPVELVLARALGAEWLDDYVADWRAVELEIDGADLIAAGIPQGPALGRGLARPCGPSSTARSPGASRSSRRAWPPHARPPRYLLS